MLKTKVKASSITNLTDARYFAAWEAEWLGFDLNPGSGNYIQPNIVKAIGEWVDGVKIIGEFEMQSAEEIQTAIDLLQLDGIQVGMFTDTDTLIQLAAEVPVIKEIIIEKGTNADQVLSLLEAFAPHVGFFLLNFDKNDIRWSDLADGSPFSLAALRDLLGRFPVILSMNLSAPQIEEVIRDFQPAGLNVKGGAEEKVGYKSFDELDVVFEALEVLE